ESFREPGQRVAVQILAWIEAVRDVDVPSLYDVHDESRRSSRHVCSENRCGCSKTDRPPCSPVRCNVPLVRASSPRCSDEPAYLLPIRGIKPIQLGWDVNDQPQMAAVSQYRACGEQLPRARNRWIQD